MAAKGIKGITIEIGGETTGLDKALKEVTTKSRNLQGELKQVERLLKLDPKNTELLAQKQKLLKESIAATKDKLDVLKKAEAQAQEQFKKGEISEEQYRALQREIVATEAQLEKLEDQAKESNLTLEKVGESAGKLGEKSEALGKKFLPVTAAIGAVGAGAIASFNEIDEGYDTIIKKTGATGDALEGLQNSMDTVFSQLPIEAETAGIAIGDVNTRFDIMGEELEEVSRQFIEFAEINDTDLSNAIINVDGIMEKFNVNASEAGSVLGLMTVAGQKTGISMDELQNTLGTNGAVLKEMGLDLTESVGLLSQFEANGVDTTAALMGLKKAQQNATAEGKTLGEALESTVEGIKNAGSETEALQIATELFGRKGALEMTQAIREGKFSVDDLSGSLSDYATVVEDTFNATLDPPDQAKIALNNLKLAGADLGDTMMGMLAPILEKVTEKVEKLKEWFGGLSDSQKETVVKIGLVVAAIGPALIIFGKLAMGFSSIMGIVGKLKGTLGAGKGLAGVLGFLSSPVVLILGGIAALAAGFLYLYNTSDSFRAKVQELFGSIKEKWESLQETLKPALEGLKAAFDALMTAVQPIIEFIMTFIGGIVMGIMSAIEPIIAAITNVIDFITNIVKAVIALVTGDFEKFWGYIKSAFQNIVDFVENIITAVCEFVKGFLSAFGTSVKEIFSKIWDGIVAIFKGVGKWFSDRFTEAYDFITGIFVGIGRWFSNRWDDICAVFKNVGTWFSDKFSAAWQAIKGVFSGWGEFFGGLWNRICTTFSNLGTRIANAIGGAVKSGINGIISTIENIINGAIWLINGAIGLINKIPGVSIGTLGEVRLPMLAKGGVVTSGKAIVAEAGPELIEMVNGKTIVTPLSSTAKNSALERNFGTGGTTADIKLNIENFYNNRAQDIRELTEEVLERAADIMERNRKAYA
jgi:Phage-related minor tail protein